MHNNKNKTVSMTKLECSALRCLAIICIILHNYAHWLPRSAQENEFAFSIDNNFYFWHSFFDVNFLIQLFSFFGHMGVPVFVFLTGYGLAQKYDHIEQLDWKKFLFSHWKKLFIPLVVGTFTYLIVMFVLKGHFVCSMNRAIVQCSMLLNLISPMHLLPMPYWYFGLTMQFYVLYLLFIHKHSTTPILLLTIISIAFTVCFPQYIRLAKFNCIGWLAPLLLGVIYSRYQNHILPKERTYHIYVLTLSIILIALSGFNYYSWLLIPIFVVIAAIGFVKYLPISFQQKIDFIGKNSMYLFVIHPITREIILPLNHILGNYLSWCLYLFTSLAIMYSFFYIKNHLSFFSLPK